MESNGDYKAEAVIEVVVKKEAWQCDVCSSCNELGAAKCEICGSQHCLETEFELEAAKKYAISASDTQTTQSSSHDTSMIDPKVEDESPDTSKSSIAPDSPQTVTSAGSFDGDQQPPDGSGKLILTEQQKLRLVQEFDRGLTNYCSQRSRQTITTLVREFSWPPVAGTKRIKQWMNKANFKARHGRSKNPKVYKKGATEYHMFLKTRKGNENWNDMKKDPAGMASLKKLAEEETERRKTCEESTQYKAALVQEEWKKIKVAMRELDELGEDAFCFFLRKNNVTETASAGAGRNFVKGIEGDQITTNFYNACRGTTAKSLRQQQQQVKELLNRKYAEAVKRPGKKVENAAIFEGRVVATLEGVEVPLRRPKSYTAAQCQTLLSANASIFFSIGDPSSPPTTVQEPATVAETSTVAEPPVAELAITLKPSSTMCIAPSEPGPSVLVVPAVHVNEQDVTNFTPVTSDDVYTVEDILDKRCRGRRARFLVKWQNFPAPTWEPYDNVKGVLENFTHWTFLK